MEWKERTVICIFENMDKNMRNYVGLRFPESQLLKTHVPGLMELRER